MTSSKSAHPGIEAWLTFIEEREQRLHEGAMFEVAKEHQIEFQAAYGVCVQAIRYAGAYVALHRLGRTREAVALARQALEHALTAQWAHFDETGPDQLIDGYSASLRRTFLTVTKFLNTPKDEIDAALDSTTGNGKRLIRVADMIKKIDFNEMFSTVYIQQSQIVHVTSETVTAFLELDKDKNFTILSEGIDPNEHQTVRFTAMATMFASWVLESLRDGAPGLAELYRRSDELALPLSIRD